MRPTIPFTGDPLDRADALRRDDAAVAALWSAPDAAALVLWRGKPLVEPHEGGVRPVAVPVADLPEAVLVRLLLGLDDSGRAVLAVGLDPKTEPPASARGTYQDLRPTAGRMSLADAALMGTARSVFAWHRSHGFCANCGQPTTIEHAGWRRRCGACSKEHFPRVDPVVIALITHGDRVLLGRGPSWPARFFSCLAGFVEPGETLGDATRREALEEASVKVGDVTYLFSQPWPFPSSLMLGVVGEAESDHLEVDGVELAQARWFSRDEVVQMLAGRHPDADAPFPIAVARHLLQWWVEQS